MAFNTALSGIRASNSDLSITGNNIANASTVGFKGSRAEFGDVYAKSLLGGGGNSIGFGVRLQDVAQDFGQGNLKFTQNELDLAINGDGFFIMNANGDTQYTRAGTFSLDKDGNIENNIGAQLQGFQADDQGNIAGVLGGLSLANDNQPPNATTDIDTQVNLDARETPLDPALFDPLDQATYNHATSVTIYDSLGNPHIMTQYFVRDSTTSSPPPLNENDWQAFAYIDGNDALGGGSNTVEFDLSGNMTTPMPLPAVTYDPNNGSEPITFNIDLTNSTQFGSEFAVSNVGQDGYTTGRLAGLDISDDGLMFARFTNGQSTLLGQVALSSFNNPNGLQPTGDTMWAETFDSGSPAVGGAGSGSLGLINSGALEESNIDLSEELVDLIIAQRNFQANTRTIETANQVTQAIINIR